MKCNLIVLLLLSISVSSYAQSPVRVGIRAGTNYVNYVNNVSIPNLSQESQENKYRFGYHFGIQTRVRLNDKLFLSPELLFNNKGYKVEIKRLVMPSGENRVSYNYLSMPIFLEYRPISRLILLFGPELNYMLSAKSKFDSETVDLFDWWNSLGDYNRFDFGLGLGMEYLISDELTFGLRYFHGFTSVFDTNWVLTDDQGNVVYEGKIPEHNRTFQLSVSYLLW